MSPSLQQQKGIALIYVLLIFALITLMASQIVTSLWLHTEKNARYLERIQARHHALSAENYVAILLEQDAEIDKKNRHLIDHKNEFWNVNTVGYEIEQGEVEITIIDEQSRFNLNWLSDDHQNNTEKGNNLNNRAVFLQQRLLQDSQNDRTSYYLEMLKNLLLYETLDPQLAYKIKDWLDSDQEVSDAGAEDLSYLSLKQARRTADTAISSISELKLIDGIGEEELEKLIPLVTVLPKTSKINLNTALPEVIQSLSKKLTPGDVQAIIDARGDIGIESLEELNRFSSLAGRVSVLRNAPVEFRSNYYSIYIKAIYRDTSFQMKTLLIRNDEGKVQVAGREIGPSQYWAMTRKDP